MHTRSKGNQNFHPLNQELLRDLRRERRDLREWLREFENSKVAMETGDGSNTGQASYVDMSNHQNPRYEEFNEENHGVRANVS